MTRKVQNSGSEHTRIRVSVLGINLVMELIWGTCIKLKLAHNFRKSKYEKLSLLVIN